MTTPVVVPAPRPVEPAAVQHKHGAVFGNRFGRNGGRVSIVGTLVLSVLIGTGLYSLQLISKWRRPTPAEADAKATGLDQPLTIAAAQDDAQPPQEAADSATASQVHSAQRSADSDGGAHQGLDGIFATANSKDASDDLSTGETKAPRAPYAPDPVSLSKASASAVDDRTVAAPEAEGERNSLLNGQLDAQPGGQPATPPGGQPASDQRTAATTAPSPPHHLDDRPAAESAAKPAGAAPSNAAYGLLDRSGASRKSVERVTQETANAAPPKQDPANAKNVNLVDFNRPAPDATAVTPPAAAMQNPDLGDAARRSLDAPGPVILPGRVAAAPAAPAVRAPNAPFNGVPSRSTDVVQADASPQLRSLTQQTPAAVDQPPVPGLQRTASTDDPSKPVYGLFDHRPGAALPDTGHPEPANVLAALDRTKVMSFQFRNAPWTVVLAEFAAETHLELRMQAIPRGVFNRYDSARYSPSQTLSILNSELARVGCTLKLEGNVLHVCALPATAAAAAATSRPAAASSPTTWFPPQSSGITPVSGRY